MSTDKQLKSAGKTFLKDIHLVYPFTYKIIIKYIKCFNSSSGFKFINITMLWVFGQPVRIDFFSGKLNNYEPINKDLAEEYDTMIRMFLELLEEI